MSVPLIGGVAKEGDRVESQPLKITTAAGIVGALVAIAAAVPLVVQAFGSTGLRGVEMLGAFLLVGAGVLALAIAWAADSLTRGYTSAWVLPKPSDKEPAVPVVQSLADAYKAAWIIAPPKDEAKAEAVPVVKLVVDEFAKRATTTAGAGAPGGNGDTPIALNVDLPDDTHLRYEFGPRGARRDIGPVTIKTD